MTDPAQTAVQARHIESDVAQAHRAAEEAVSWTTILAEPGLTEVGRREARADMVKAMGVMQECCARAMLCAGRLLQEMT